MPNNFHEDNNFQRTKRDTILVPYFYKRHFWERYRLLDGQKYYQERGIDTLVYTGTAAVTYIEEKIVRKLYTAFALETESCTIPGYEKSGWMAYGEADRMLYCFTISTWLDCWWLDFPALQKWFWPREQDFPRFQMEERNRTAGRVVPINEIEPSIIISNFQVGVS